MINLVEVTETEFNALKVTAKYRGTLRTGQEVWRNFYNKQDGVENCWSKYDEETKATTFYKQNLY